MREAYVAYRTAYDLARHYRDEIVPLRKRIAEENLLRYNGMLIGVFELLADAREQIAQRHAGHRRAARLLAGRCRLAWPLIGKPSLTPMPSASARCAAAIEPTDGLT